LIAIAHVTLTPTVHISHSLGGAQLRPRYQHIRAGGGWGLRHCSGRLSRRILTQSAQVLFDDRLRNIIHMTLPLRGVLGSISSMLLMSLCCAALTYRRSRKAAEIDLSLPTKLGEEPAEIIPRSQVINIALGEMDGMHEDGEYVVWVYRNANLR